MADMDLATALNMFTQGAQSLQMQRALQNANDQVNQIKTTEGNEAAQRQALSQVAQHLTMNMMAAGANSDQISTATGAVGPAQYKDANAMHMAGLLNNDPHLMQLAKIQDDFESPPETNDPKALTPYQQQSLALEKQKVDNTISQQNTTDFEKLNKEANSFQASSRSGFGQWRQTNDRGDRLQQIMQDRSQWKDMSIPDMTLVKDGLGYMSKGAALTSDESEALAQKTLAMRMALAKGIADGKPATLDLSGYMKDFNNVIENEGAAAKHGMLQSIVNTYGTNAKSFYKRDPEQFKTSVATSLNRQLGLSVDPKDVAVDAHGQLNIKGVTDRLDMVNQAPKHLADAIKDLRNQNAPAEDRKGAQQFLDAYGITPNMKPQDALKVIQRKMKASIFQGN